MKMWDCIKSDKFICFGSGVLAAALGTKALKSEKARKVCVNGLAKCMQLGNDVKEALQNMKEEAEDICYDAQQQAENVTED